MHCGISPPALLLELFVQQIISIPACAAPSHCEFCKREKPARSRRMWITARSSCMALVLTAAAPLLVAGAQWGHCEFCKREQARRSAAQVDYNPQQLDALALVFTAAKLLFVGGALCRCRRLAALVEPARRASRRPLHQTLVRNEAAYFGCVAQLLGPAHAPPPAPAPGLEREPLYLLGDSHCLSGALLCTQARKKGVCCKRSACTRRSCAVWQPT